MTSLLFIAPADSGETVLATGVLAHAMAQLGDARVAVVCNGETAPLFRALPGLETLQDRGSDDSFARWVALTWRHAKKPLDFVLDLDGAPSAYSVRARRRITRRRSPTLRHRVEEWSELAGANAPLAPKLWLDDRARKDAKDPLAGAGPLLVLAPCAESPGKRWPAERFAAIARRLASGAGPLVSARIVILGDDHDDAARIVAASLAADGVGARNLAGVLDLASQAALLEHATLFIGNDGVTMHLAAAANAPTLGLFGPSDERVRGPYGARTRSLRGRDYEAIMALAHASPDEKNLMNDISVDAVEEAALSLLRAGGLR